MPEHATPYPLLVLYKEQNAQPIRSAARAGLGCACTVETCDLSAAVRYLAASQDRYDVFVVASQACALKTRLQRYRIFRVRVLTLPETGSNLVRFFRRKRRGGGFFCTYLIDILLAICLLCLVFIKPNTCSFS